MIEALGQTLILWLSLLIRGWQPPGFGDLTPQSPKWMCTLNDSGPCTGVTFYRKQ